MIDLLSFSLCSVSLDGGNPTVLQGGHYTEYPIKSIEVLDEECGKTGMEREMSFLTRTSSQAGVSFT